MNMVNKKIAIGLVGALGVAAASQVPGVQAEIDHLTNNDDSHAKQQGSASSQIKENSSKNAGITTTSKVAKAASDAVETALDVVSSAGTIVATPASAVDETSSAAGISTLLTPAESAAVNSTKTVTTSDTTKYTVADGDTLGSIATEFEVPYVSLQAANNGIDSSSIQTGQSIVIPDAKANDTTKDTTGTESDNNSSVTTNTVDQNDNDSSVTTNTVDQGNDDSIGSDVTNQADANDSNSVTTNDTGNTNVDNGSDVSSDADDDVNNDSTSNNDTDNGNGTASNNNDITNNDSNDNVTPDNDESNNDTGSVPDNNNSNSEISAAQQATLDALNVLRTSRGLKPVIWDNSLAARAQSRANLINSTGQIPDDHWSWGAGPEVIAIDWAAGAPVINAWNIDDASVGMITDNSGHRRWLLSPDTTAVGFGMSGSVIDGISNGTDFSIA